MHKSSTSEFMPADQITQLQPQTVSRMFSEIAGRYDTANDVLSFGLHRLWKKKLVRLANVQNGDNVLDVATGTGDIAARFASLSQRPHVTGVDFSQAMIQIAIKRWRKLHTNLHFKIADAMCLPFPAGAFSVASISFGIRNVEHPHVVLKEMLRVLAPGGRMLILEFGQPTGMLGTVYRFYSHNILPFLGGIISGNMRPYKYLDRTAAEFPCGEKVLQIMNTAGVKNSSATALLGGIAYLYKGIKN